MAPAALPSPTSLAAPADRHRLMLEELADLAMDLARAVHRAATANPERAPGPDATASFDRLARTVRRTVLLLRHLAEPPRHNPDRVAVRRQVLRRVEDRIGAGAEDGNADSLRAELAERLDAPELEDELGENPTAAHVATLIENICRDLGLSNDPALGLRPFRRRTPRDVADLHARAARPPRARPNHDRPDHDRPDPARPCHNRLPTPPPPG